MIATLEHLRFLGAIAHDAPLQDSEVRRAEGLLSMAEAQCLSHLRRTEAEVTAWDDADRLTFCTIVAEVAARRLTSSAAASVIQLADGQQYPQRNAILSRGDRRALDRIPSSGRPGTGSFTVERADAWEPRP